MKNLSLNTSTDVESVFENYPDAVREQMKYLRNLIIETASDTKEIETLEETLKWSEPSYLAKNGSTIRIDWKKKAPYQYAMYFTCTTELVPTFKQLYSDVFTFEGDRAITFKLDDELPEPVLKRCITAALRYHKVKHLPMLGL